MFENLKDDLELVLENILATLNKGLSFLGRMFTEPKFAIGAIIAISVLKRGFKTNWLKF